MANEPLLNFDDLLAPLPGDDPAGEAVSFTVRAEMEEDRKEIDPADFDANDPLRPTEAKKADWKGIANLSIKTLTTSSKDLLVAARLTEALTKLHGFAGLAEGIILLRRLLAECWDRMHPKIDDGDLDVRAGPLNWLGDDGRGARFPYTVRTVPLFKGDGGWYTQRDWKNIQENKGPVKRDDFERALNATSRQQCQALIDDLTRCNAELAQLLAVLNDKLGNSAPGLIDLRAALSDTLVLLNQALARKPLTVSTTETPIIDAPAEATTAAPAARPLTSRAAIYARLGEAADALERMEPHSPVPYLIRRAVALGQLPFPQMMKALMREEFKNALEEMNRELGIKEGDPPATVAPAAAAAQPAPASSGW